MLGIWFNMTKDSFQNTLSAYLINTSFTWLRSLGVEAVF